MASAAAVAAERELKRELELKPLDEWEEVRMPRALRQGCSSSTLDSVRALEPGVQLTLCCWRVNGLRCPEQDRRRREVIEDQQHERMQDVHVTLLVVVMTGLDVCSCWVVARRHRSRKAAMEGVVRILGGSV